jgi:hypothetical protein
VGVVEWVDRVLAHAQMVVPGRPRTIRVGPRACAG